MVKLEKLVDEKVTHKMFGTGMIVEVSMNYLIVSFQNNLQKKFTYPNCFEAFLMLENEELMNEISKELQTDAPRKCDFNACLDKMHEIDKRVKVKQEAWLQAQRDKLERQRLYRKQRLRTGQ